METAKIPPFNKKAAQKLLHEQWYINYALVTLGSLILASGIVFFIVPFDFVPGGVYGLSILIHELTGWPIGMISLGVNIPLLLLGTKVLGANLGVKTVYSMVISSVAIDFFQLVLKVPALTDNILVGAIFGGFLVGLGVSIVIRGNASTGGTDTVGQLISHFTKIAVGKLFLVIDGVIVLAGILVFMNIDSAPYAIISIFVISRTVDYMISGFENRKAVFIISEKTEALREFILNDLDRTGTLLMGKGLYFSDQDRRVILTTLTRKEMMRLQNYIAHRDPEAFVMAFNTTEVFGSGFKPLI